MFDITLMRKEMQDVLEQNILHFWMTQMVDEAHGGFYGRIDNSGTLHPKAEKGAILNARILWSFSAAYRVLKEVRGEDGEVKEVSNIPPLPFLCLLVSGGNSQIVKVNAYNDMEVLGQTIDDAAGEAIDKCSKVMGLGYPGGPIIDRLARQGNPEAYSFAKPQIPGYDYSFSGLKTSFLYSLREWMQDDPDFIEHHKEDLAASLERTIVDILMAKLRKAVKDTKIKHVAVAGGVSANNGLRNAFHEHADKYKWNIYIPKFGYTTDNAAMIGITGYFKYLDKDFCSIDKPAYSRVTI